MNVGDIIINPWVSKLDGEGKLNPIYATIYLGGKRSVDFTGHVCTWSVEPEKSEKEWRVIGHCDLQELVESYVKEDKGVKHHGKMRFEI